MSVAATNPINNILIQKNDCQTCHQLNKTSVGPSFMAIAERYKNNLNEKNRLADKIINGGGGKWGNTTMSAHPQLSNADAMRIVNYIVGLSK